MIIILLNVVELENQGLSLNLALEIYRQAALKTGAINTTVPVKAEKAKTRPTHSKEYIHVYDSMADIKQGTG